MYNILFPLLLISGFTTASLNELSFEFNVTEQEQTDF